MDASRPTTTKINFSSFNYYDRAQEKLIRHKLFLLSCEKLAELRSSNAGNALKRNLAILSVCKKARSSDFYPVNECLNLLTSRESNTRSGPLFTRRSTSSSTSTTVASSGILSSTTTSRTTTSPRTISTTTMPVNVVTAYTPQPIVVPQAVQNDTMMMDDEEEDDSYPTFMPTQKVKQLSSTKISSNHQKTKQEKKWSLSEEIFEHSVKDINGRSLQTFDFDTSDTEIEEGTDALDIFFMDEDGASMARKRKSFQWDSVAEKRHCDEEVISPKSTSTPIPIPRPVKQPDQVVLDTLVPMRGFFQFR
jgi:hypothetical protein